MLGKHRQDHCLELTPLRLVDGDRISQIQLNNIILLVYHLPAIGEKCNYAGKLSGINPFNCSDISIKHLQVIVVSPMNYSIAYPKNPLTNLHLRFVILRWIGCLLNHLVQVDCS